jgi:FMN reductase
VSVVVVGNPKLNSRTREAAEMLAEALEGAAPSHVVEVAEFGSGLLGRGDPAVAQAKDLVKSTGLLIVASPTFKATYSGLLKLFLDQFAADELRGVTGVPLMLGAAPHHALAPELLLKPVLVEIGCTCPTPGLYLLESTFRERVEMDKWLLRARDVIPAVA